MGRISGAVGCAGSGARCTTGDGATGDAGLLSTCGCGVSWAGRPGAGRTSGAAGCTGSAARCTTGDRATGDAGLLSTCGCGASCAGMSCAGETRCGAGLAGSGARCATGGAAGAGRLLSTCAACAGSIRPPDADSSGGCEVCCTDTDCAGGWGLSASGPAGCAGGCCKGISPLSSGLRCTGSSAAGGCCSPIPSGSDNSASKFAISPPEGSPLNEALVGISITRRSRGRPGAGRMDGAGGAAGESSGFLCTAGAPFGTSLAALNSSSRLNRRLPGGRVSCGGAAALRLTSPAAGVATGAAGLWAGGSNGGITWPRPSFSGDRAIAWLPLAGSSLPANGIFMRCQGALDKARTAAGPVRTAWACAAILCSSI